MNESLTACESVSPSTNQSVSQSVNRQSVKPPHRPRPVLPPSLTYHYRRPSATLFILLIQGEKSDLLPPRHPPYPLQKSRLPGTPRAPSCRRPAAANVWARTRARKEAAALARGKSWELRLPL